MTTKTRLIVTAAGASLLLVLVWFFLLWSPQGDKLDDAKAEKVAAEQRASELAARLTHLKDLKANAPRLEADRALLSQAIPDTDRLDDFIIRTNELASLAGVSFVSISPNKPAAGAPAEPQVMALQIQAAGDYFAVMRFLDAIRDTRERLMTIESIAMPRPAEGGQMTVGITGRMFVGPQPIPPVPTESA